MESFDLNDIKSSWNQVLSFLKDMISKRKENSSKPQSLSQKNISFNFSNSGFQAPIKGEWFNSGDYSPDRPTDKNHPKGHKGIDMRAPGGTPVYPMADGKVTFVGTDPMGGNIVNIEHGNGIRTYYAHLGTASVRKSDIVSKETQIGTVGESGNAKGTVPHCHFQVWVNGKITNPSEFFSVPKYSRVSREETRWLPGQEEVASRWNMRQHLSGNTSKTASAILERCSAFEKMSNQKKIIP
jgi:murein DD-endopeptidase MepM/ murein hydrolase activator NlpD